MMNKQKTRKVWNWKVATFLPMLALLLMAFGKSGEKPTETKMTANLIIQQQQEIQPVKEGITNDQLTEYMASDQTKINTKGQVLKSDGQPISGASVLLKGSTLRTITDQEGKFELKGIPSDGELVILHAGYKNKDIKATEKMMRITMEDGKSTPPPPPPLILTKMYDSLLDRTNPPSIFLDGVQIERKAMDQVDVKKIQTIKVMLDQEATDKYGDQGKNGVIQITMKSAKQKTLAK